MPATGAGWPARRSRCRSSWSTSPIGRTRSIRPASATTSSCHGTATSWPGSTSVAPGGSEGHAVDEYVAQEQVDGYDAIEWMAAQPWCDGHVNMIGISYGGFTALQVATLQPPHLTSIIPVDFTDDRYTDDCHYRGGLLRMYYDVGYYGTRMIAWNAMPTDPTFAADGARTIWERHVAEDEPYLLAWLTHQVDGPYWRQGSVADIVDRIVCPTFLIGGWRDGYPNPPTRLFERLTAPKKLLIGPWDHRYPDAGIPGPRIDHLRDVVRWLDHWCLGRDDGLMDEPAIVVFMQEAGSLAPGRLESTGRWRAETDLAAGGRRRARVRPRGRRTPVRRRDRRRTPSRPGPTVSSSIRPSGLANGLWSGGVQFGLTADQRPDEALSLTYTSRPLDAPLSILGRARADLFVSSDVDVLGVAVSLSDVDPDGSVAPRRQGHAQRHASSVLDRSAATGSRGGRPAHGPGRCDRAGGSAPATGSACRSPAPTGRTSGRRRRPPRSTVHRGSRRRRRGSRCRSSPTRAPSRRRSSPRRPWSRVTRPPSTRPPAWTVTHDALTGRVVSEIRFQTTHVTPEGTRIERDARNTCEVDPVDPAHAVARGWHRCASSRDGHAVESRADVVLASTETDLHLTIDLAVTRRRRAARHPPLGRAHPARPALTTRTDSGEDPMADPTPRLEPGGPLEVVEARTLFADAPPGRRSAASMVRIESTGRLLMCFSHVIGVDLRNQAALVVTSLGRRRRDLGGAARPVRLPGLVLARDGRPGPHRRRQHQGDARPDPDRPVAGRHGADDRLVRRLDDDPRRRRQLVGPVARDPPVPGVDRALRREQPASARRRPPPLGGHGHPRPRLRLARRGQRQRRPRASTSRCPRSSPRRTAGTTATST